jgi:antitoxin component of RelBE/YafQ-DinJ toxin-antitoxin module
VKKRKYTERLEIRIGSALKEVAEDVADQHNLSLSEFVRDFLEKEAAKFLKKRDAEARAKK